MTSLFASQLRLILCCCALLISILLPASALADNWQLQVGAQNGDRSHQAIAFLPNEIWIHSGDSITWAFPANDIHTVTFLTPLQVRPNRFTGCAGGAPPDGRTPDFSVYDGTACVNSGVLTSEDGQTYTVVFPVTGNFKLVCLVHPNMTATIHVLALPTALAHDQVFYDKEADLERAALLHQFALGRCAFRIYYPVAARSYWPGTGPVERHLLPRALHPTGCLPVQMRAAR